MALVRKIDYYIQWSILALMFISIPVMYQFGFLAGLFCLGIIQLLSSVLNTTSFIHRGLRKGITRYWWFVVIDLLLFVPILSGKDPEITTILFCIQVVGATVIALYYLIIYKKLQGLIYLRNELSGFTKS